MGEGDGPGIGDGSGGGIGGGPYRAGSGIDPPLLLREVKPDYTEDARRRGIVGEVVMEISSYGAMAASVTSTCSRDSATASTSARWMPSGSGDSPPDTGTAPRSMCRLKSPSSSGCGEA